VLASKDAFITLQAWPILNHLTENKPVHRKRNSPQSGLLIVNADDWGRDAETTNRILDCVLHGSVSSASAMVFMEDSERAAALACAEGVDVGLHLNFTTPFGMPGCTARLASHQSRLGHFLSRNRLSQMCFHPGLASSFRYVVAAQLEEFRRLYNSEPARIDGHHHMHLCANVVFAGLLPAGTITRRNFSFQSGEKSAVNRLYRRFIDNILAKRHPLTDFFYSLPPLEPSERLTRILTLAKHFVVEVETHPVNPEEYSFLMADKIFNQIGDVPIASSYRL
jgi:chitin disaccharide deacetylase